MIGIFLNVFASLFWLISHNITGDHKDFAFLVFHMGCAIIAAILYGCQEEESK